MNEKIEIQKTEIPVVKGTEVIFIVAICVDEQGSASIAFNSKQGVNMERVGEALKEFACDIIKNSPSIKKGPSEA